MKQQKQDTAQILRFRRWSRTAYAVFASLSAVVSIGFLAVSVSEKSRLSNEYYAQIAIETSSATDEEVDKDKKEDFLLSLEATITKTLNSDDAAACSDIFISLTQTD